MRKFGFSEAMMRIARSILISAVVLTMGAASIVAQSLYKVELDDRIDGSDKIVEGRVVKQRAEWNPDGTLIYTISTIEVYRDFKGDARHPFVEVIAPGGRIDLHATVVTPALLLEPGDVGVFMLQSDTETFERPMYRAFASVQGFIRYDEATGGAADVFDTFPDIGSSVRFHIEDRLGEPASVVKEYDLAEKLEGSAGKTSLAPVITGVSPNPTTAGTGSEIFITGVGFGTFDNGVNSAVFFPNSDDGGSTLRGAGKELVSSWNDTEIRLKVPTGAGTGKVTVQNADKQTGLSTDDLVLDFNRIQITYEGTVHTPDLINKNGTGGYSLAMSTNAADGGVNFAASPAVAPFEAALATWQIQTGLNVRLNGGVTASNKVDPGADPDILMFDNDDTSNSQPELPLQHGILGRTFQQYIGCGDPPLTWWMSGFDMVFRRSGTDGVVWHFGSSQPPFQEFDFQTVAVHELGHAHQLGHIIARDKVMHYSVRNGDTVRELDKTSDVTGGLYVLANRGNLSICGQRPMTPLVSVGVGGDELPSASIAPEAFPNPFASQVRVSFNAPAAEDVSVELYDVLGRRLRAYPRLHAIGGTRVEIDIDGADLTPGVYLVQFTGETFTTSMLVTRR